MDVKAVLLLGVQQENEPHTAESIAGVPIALLPILGRPIVQRVVDNLRLGGVEDIHVISDARASSLSLEHHAQSEGVTWLRAPGEKIWKAAEDCISNFAQAGSELVILIRLGAYLEFPVDDLIQFHLDQNARVTRVSDGTSAYDYFVLSASRLSDTAFLLQQRLRKMRTASLEYRAPMYANPLANAADVRRLIHDSLMKKTRIVPIGREIRSGVWVGKGAKIERGARLVAPVYIGERAVVRSSALVTRCSSVEHHAEIDCGTILEDSTVMPYSYVGAGLEVAHSTVAFRQLTNHRRNVTIEVVDPALLNMVPDRMLAWVKTRIAAWLRGRPGRDVRRPEPRRTEELHKLSSLTPPLETSAGMEPAVAEGTITKDSVNY